MERTIQRRMLRRRMIWCAAVALLGIAAGCWWYYASPLRIVARFPIADDGTVIVRRAGILCFDGGDIGAASGESCYDWRGARRWRIALQLVMGEHRDVALSPEGHFTVLIRYDAKRITMSLWHDGKPSGDTISPRTGDVTKPVYPLVTDDGRVLLRQGDGLTIVQDGRILAATPHLGLPRSMPGRILPQYILALDGQTLYVYYWNKDGTDLPGLDIIPLLIDKGTVRTGARLRYPTVYASAYRHLLDDGTLFTAFDGVYGPSGHLRPATSRLHHLLYSFEMESLYYNKCDPSCSAIPQIPDSRCGPFDVNYPATGKSWRVPLEHTHWTVQLRLSSDGSAVLVEEVPEGNIHGRIGALPFLDKIWRWFNKPDSSSNISLYRQPGVRVLSLNVVDDADGNRTVEIAGARYILNDYALSPDGSRILLQVTSPARGHEVLVLAPR